MAAKNNLSGERTGLAFRLVADEERGVPRVEWSSEAIEATADEVFAAVRASSKEQPKAVQAAMAFLTEALKDGPRLVKELEAEAKEQGISQITLRRARTALGVGKVREGKPGRCWVGLGEEGQAGIRSQESGVGERKSVDHVEHLANDTGDLKEKVDDHVDQVAEGTEDLEEEWDEDDAEEQDILREALAASEWVNLPEDVLLRDLFGGDRHESGQIGKMSIFGEGQKKGLPRSKRKRKAK